MLVHKSVNIFLSEKPVTLAVMLLISATGYTAKLTFGQQRICFTNLDHTVCDSTDACRLLIKLHNYRSTGN